MTMHYQEFIYKLPNHDGLFKIQVLLPKINFILIERWDSYENDLISGSTTWNYIDGHHRSYSFSRQIINGKITWDELDYQEDAIPEYRIYSKAIIRHCNSLIDKLYKMKTFL